MQRTEPGDASQKGEVLPNNESRDSAKRLVTPRVRRRRGGASGRGPFSFAALVGYAALLVMAAVVILPERVPGLVPAEDWSSDRRTAWLSPSLSRPHPIVAIVAITDDTLDAYKTAGTRPLDRGMLAEIVRAIDHQGACAMALDVYVLRATTPDKDDALIAALTDARMDVIMGVADSRVEMRADQRLGSDGQLDF
jgi:CHASE2 domain-containing sensor protein